MTKTEERSASAVLDSLGTSHSVEDYPSHEHDENHGRDWLRVGFVALVIGIVWWGAIPRFHGFDLVALAGILIGGLPIFNEAIGDLLKGRMTMELSMTIALVAASAIGEFFTALLITVFVLIAEIIEGMTVGRGRGPYASFWICCPRQSRSEATAALPRARWLRCKSATWCWCGQADIFPWTGPSSAVIPSSIRPR